MGVGNGADQLTGAVMALFVQMHDKFMSRWGMAEGKINLFVVECDTEAQAVAVQKAAEDRREMRRIKMANKLAKSTSGCLVSHRHFRELGGSWLDYYRGEPA